MKINSTCLHLARESNPGPCSCEVNALPLSYQAVLIYIKRGQDLKLHLLRLVNRIISQMVPLLDTIEQVDNPVGRCAGDLHGDLPEVDRVGEVMSS